MPYVVALVVFIGLALAYCSPVMDGKVLQAGDVNTWKGSANEAREFLAENGYSPWWTNSQFGGMPTYQITGGLPSSRFHGTIQDIARCGFSGDYTVVGLIFAYLAGFFLLLICFGVNPWLSIIGACALTLSTYFMLIIPAGHLTKAAGLAFLAPVIGGFYAIMRRKYWLGIPLILVYGFLSVTLHPQMTYYIMMLVGVMACAELYIHIRDKRWKDLGIGVGICVLCALLLFGTKFSWWSMNTEYVKHTMRGGHSELTQKVEEKDTDTGKGLDLKYATDWSYGKAETMTLLIPGWEGNASGYNVGTESVLYEEMRANLSKYRVPSSYTKSMCEGTPIYRGEKMFTSGAVYVGAIICFLFILGLLIVPGPYKWALLFATLMSFFLAWGRNWMGLTELFFNYFPMYNKFRAVESILVVAEITMPLLGFLGLQKIVSGEIEWKKLRTCLFIAGGITAGICLFAALFAGTFDLTSTYDRDIYNEAGELVRSGNVDRWMAGLKQGLGLPAAEYNRLFDSCYEAVLDQRAATLRADAWRSLLFVLLGFGLTFWYAWQRNKSGFQKKHMAIFIAGLAALILFDMIPVNKRFFNDNNFVKAKANEAYFKIQPWEEEILQDKTLDYRVLNLTTSTFNDSRTSYRLKSIGGYSAVKLRRYQDLIDAHISEEISDFYQAIFRTNGFYEPDPKNGAEFPVLNMLNTRYAVIGLRDGSSVPIQNPYAMGNAWFVNEVQFVPTPDDESAALNTIDLHKTAVADEKFRDVLTCTGVPSATDEIVMTEYQPNKLTYTANVAQDRVAVFSEIYYPNEWHLYVDNVEVPIGRVNYVLRAAVIPAGEHTIVMKFVPEALKLDKWCIAFDIILILIALVALSFPLWRRYISQNKP